MGGSETDQDPDDQIRMDAASEPRRPDERGREPQSSDDEESEDNDGGPPSSRRH